MSYFWCEKHKQAHRKGDDQRSCLLVGPFTAKATAESWNGSIRPAKATASPYDCGGNPTKDYPGE